MQILVVEKDRDYALVIAETLRFAGHEIVTSGSTESAMQFVLQTRPDVAVLATEVQSDANLDFCESLRSMFPELPIVLIAPPGRSSSIISGFARGADDYIVKPFHPGELSARVDALIRRSRLATPPGTVLFASGLSLDQRSRSVAWRDEPLACTQTEFAILQELMASPGQMVTHTHLNAEIWRYPDMHDGSLLKSHVSSLRKKLREAGCASDLIRSVHGVGYVLTVDEPVTAFATAVSA